MTNDKRAKELLASSYVLSAGRIRDAVQGGLSIQNSRAPSSGPSFPGEVVGLCGQGGRHPYFKIPINILRAALDRIEQAGNANAVEEIAAACQDLRQQAYFDTGTGCANDTFPSMVPLLPPEEIWFDGRELPMDVWRLVSFDFDLVSASVSSQVSVTDFAFSAVTQSALAFRFLIKQVGNRRVTFEVELNNMPVAWIPGGSKTITMNVSLARVFFEAGSLLTPLAGEEFTKWYGAVRYLHWIDSSVPELRVRDVFDQDSVDSRYRGLFAEETGIGLMAIVLSDIFGAKPINNTVEVLDPMWITKGRPIADFVAEATEPGSGRSTTIVAESKGSLRARISKKRHDRAKDQVTETAKSVLFAGSVQALPLAFGSTICFSTQLGKSRCLVDDPPADFNPDAIRIDPVRAWRVAYAKVFGLVGLDTAGQQVLRGGPLEAVRPIDFDRELDRRKTERDDQRLRRGRVARERFGVDLLLDVGPYAVSINARVLAILRGGLDAEAVHRLSEIVDSRHGRTSGDFRGDSFEGSLGIGCVAYSDLDERTDRDRRL